MAPRRINGTDIHVESVGSGPPLLMMHGGLGLDHTYFRPYFDQLADQATIIYYDHRGNGRSARPDDHTTGMTFDHLVADAVGVIDDLGFETATVLGHSYGGFIAQKLATAHADRLSGLVLVSTVPAFDYQPTPSGTDDQVAAFGRLFSEPVADDDEWRSLWNTVLPMYFHRWDGDEADRIDRQTHYVAGAWNAAAGLLGTYNTLDDLPNIDVPSLCVGGVHDFITPPEPGVVRMADRLPAAELAVFESSGHYPFIEEQDRFFGELRAFLTRLT